MRISFGQLLTMLLLFISSHASCQDISFEDKLWQTTDSILLSKTDKTFITNLIRNPIWSTNLSRINLNGDTIRLGKRYYIDYQPKRYDRHSLHITQNFKGLKPLEFSFEIDSNLLIKPSNSIDDNIKYCKRYYSAKLITEKEARQTAKVYFSPKFKSTYYYSSILIYDTVNDQFSWSIKRYSGFMNVTVKVVYIDAEKKEFIRTKIESYRMNFWQALFKKRNI